MKPSRSSDSERVAQYFDTHAQDFDSIYEHDKPMLRALRDRLSRGTVVDRLAYVNQVADQTRPQRVLDVGCGSGRFAVELAKRGAAVVGLDFAADMIAMADKAAADASVAERCTFLQADFMTWPTEEKFDLALAIGVFDYVGDHEALLAKLSDVSDGRVIASLPRRLHPLAPLRFVRLRANRCPVYFYGRKQIEVLGQRHISKHRPYEVVPFHRDFLLVGRP